MIFLWYVWVIFVVCWWWLKWCVNVLLWLDGVWWWSCVVLVVGMLVMVLMCVCVWWCVWLGMICLVIVYVSCILMIFSVLSVCL